MVFQGYPHYFSIFVLAILSIFLLVQIVGPMLVMERLLGFQNDGFNQLDRDISLSYDIVPISLPKIAEMILNYIMIVLYWISSHLLLIFAILRVWRKVEEVCHSFNDPDILNALDKLEKKIAEEGFGNENNTEVLAYREEAIPNLA